MTNLISVRREKSVGCYSVTITGVCLLDVTAILARQVLKVELYCSYIIMENI